MLCLALEPLISHFLSSLMHRHREYRFTCFNMGISLVFLVFKVLWVCNFSFHASGIHDSKKYQFLGTCDIHPPKLGMCRFYAIQSIPALDPYMFQYHAEAVDDSILFMLSTG